MFGILLESCNHFLLRWLEYYLSLATASCSDVLECTLVLQTLLAGKILGMCLGVSLDVSGPKAGLFKSKSHAQRWEGGGGGWGQTAILVHFNKAPYSDWQGLGGG